MAMQPEEAYRLGVEGRGDFLAHGWWISPRVLDDAVLEELDYGIDRFYGDDLDWHLPAVPPGDTPRGPFAGTRQNDYVSLQVREVRQFVLAPLLGALLAGLGGHDGVRLFHDQLIEKAPGAPSVGWHSDRSYWLTCSSADMLTAWIPLTDVDESNGALRVIDGSVQARVDHDALRGFHNPEATVPDELTCGETVILPLIRGQVSFHHARTLHSSCPNRTTRKRTAVAVHVQPTDNRYTPPSGAAPRLHFNDVLCRRDDKGMPDYADPYVCPVMWPAVARRA